MSLFNSDFEIKKCLVDMLDKATFGQAEAITTALDKWEELEKLNANILKMGKMIEIAIESTVTTNAVDSTPKTLRRNPFLAQIPTVTPTAILVRQYNNAIGACRL